MAIEDIIKPLLDDGWTITFTISSENVTAYAYTPIGTRGTRTKMCSNIAEAAIQIRKDIAKEFEPEAVWS